MWRSSLKLFVDQSSQYFGTIYETLVIINALTRLSISFFPMTYSVKIAVKLRRRRKKWFLGPRFVGGGDTPDFGDVFSNCAYFRPCGRFWLSYVQRARRVRGENKEKRKKNPVKQKSSDNFARRTNKLMKFNNNNNNK